MPSRHPLVQTLLELKGNPRACVLTEPLWGIPYNLIAPYASLYMLALGVTTGGIGLVASIGMASQILFALLSGALTDKFGRRWTTFLVDLVSWSIPCLIWAFAQDLSWFVAAALLNSTFRIAATSWGCLLVEDSDRSQIVNIYTWIYVAGVVAAFFAPLSGLFIGENGLVTTVRVLYLLAFVMMTAKFVLLFAFSTETAHGKVRRQETRNVPLTELFSGYRGVLGQIVRNPGTMLTLSLMVVMNICSTVNSVFWSVFATTTVGVPESWIGLFPFLRALIMLIVFFTLVPRIRALRFRRPMLTGLVVFAASQGLLLSAPVLGIPALIGSVVLEALALAMISPLLDSMQVVLVDPKERARIISILYVCVLALGSPFGWIAGLLAGADPRLPFVLNLVLLTLAFVVTVVLSRARSMERL
jgi:MFS family permease